MEYYRVSCYIVHEDIISPQHVLSYLGNKNVLPKTISAEILTFIYTEENPQFHPS